MLPLLSGLVTDVVRTREELIAENILLRQQLVVAARKVKRPAFRPHERGLIAALTKLVPRNHTVWACDFLQVYDVSFRPMFAFFIVDINTKRVVHAGVTCHPTQQWTTQQLREVTPFGEGPQFLIRDRDDKFGVEFDRVAKGAGIKIVKTAVRAPLMNSVVERFLGSVRRECLDHMLILRERHLQSVLNEYCFEYFNVSRPHQGLGNRVPTLSNRESCDEATNVIGVPVLGGLHHDYRRAA